MWVDTDDYMVGWSTCKDVMSSRREGGERVSRCKWAVK